MFQKKNLNIFRHPHQHDIYVYGKFYKWFSYFSALPTSVAVNVLCEGSEEINVFDMKNSGFIKSKNYPSPFYGRTDCKAYYEMPAECKIIRLEFLNFYTHTSNELSINEIVFYGSKTGETRILDISEDNKLRFHVRFLQQYRYFEQKILLKFTCGKESTQSPVSVFCFAVKGTFTLWL